MQVHRVQGWLQVSPVVQVSDSGQRETGPKGALGALCINEHDWGSKEWAGVQVPSWRGEFTVMQGSPWKQG